MMRTNRRLVSTAIALLALVLSAALPAGADVIIPSSAFSSGAQQAEFHSDVRVFNPGASAVTFTPIFYNQGAGGGVFTGTVTTIPGRSQLSFDNVLSSLFGRPLGSFGPIRFVTTSKLVVSSSVNNVNSCGFGATAGQWLPGIDQSQAVRTGVLVQLAVSIEALTGYRTNVDFINPGTATANVTVKIHKGDGTLLTNVILPPLGANGFFQKRLDDAIFPGVIGITDTNLWLEFSSDQPVLAFASVINNGSGDPFAIVAVADTPPTSGPVPITITATTNNGIFSTFDPNTVQLTVGTTYQITWQSNDVTHGVGGLAVLGITQCFTVSPSAPCTVLFTPTSNQLGTYKYACTQTTCSAQHLTMFGNLVITNPQ